MASYKDYMLSTASRDELSKELKLQQERFAFEKEQADKIHELDAVKEYVELIELRNSLTKAINEHQLSEHESNFVTNNLWLIKHKIQKLLKENKI